MKSDYPESYQKEDQTIAVLSLTISKYKNNAKLLISFKKTNKLTYFFCISLYIHGGRDIKVGPLSSMWRLSIAGVEDLKIHKDAGV